MAKGSKFLQIVGIVMIVCGGIATIVDLLAVVGALALGAAAAALAGVNPTMLILTTIVALLSAIAMLVAGILGVVNHNKVEKAQTCFTCGIAVIVLSVLGSIILPLVSSSGIAWLGAIFGLVLPGLYIYGAMLNKQS